MPTLLLVDGSSYLYRAFHALPDLRNAASEPTGALYGVLNMLRRLNVGYNATHAACIFDAKGKTFRDDWYPDYKANRPPMPPDLVQQIEPIHACVKAMGWPLLMVDGVEADDVIGTLARQAAAQGFEVIISTGDKDMAQLVTDQIKLVNTMSNETLDPQGVLEKFGVPPERIVDYLTLIGDTVDNVPGVSKCGPKTAVKWLTEYQTLEGIVQNAPHIKGVVGENLRQALDFIPLGKKLVTIVTDLSLPVKVQELLWVPQDKAVLAENFRRYEFRSWLKEIEGGSAMQMSASQGGKADIASNLRSFSREDAPVAENNGEHRKNYETILDWESFDRWLEKINACPLTAFDTETDSLEPMRAQLVGMSFAVAEGEAAYIPLNHQYAGVPDQLPMQEVLARLKPWLEDETRHKVGQNLKYDMHVLYNQGITLRGVAHDTLLESAAWESDKGHDLEQLCRRHLGLSVLSYTDLCGKGAKQIGFGEVDIERASAYAAEDADVTLRVHNVLHPKVLSEPGLKHIYEAIEMPALPVLWEMERNGILIDAFLLAQQSNELGRKIMDIELQAHELAEQPFNLGSPKQIREIFFDQLKLPVIKKTPSGEPSTDEEVLQQLALDYPLPKLILEHRGMSKLKSTYTDKLPRMVDPKTGRVHTSFSQTGAVTGRLASSEPNLQNIPVRTPEGRRIRAAFIARNDWHIVSADYSQIELRIMAHLSEDPALLKAFADGLDVHQATAAEVFGMSLHEVTSDQRRYAKAINFGLIYGMSAHGLAKQLELDRTAAQNYIDRYFARYPGVARYMEQTRQFARENGFVQTVFGRRLWLPEIAAAQQARRQGAERAAINAPMQGTAADIVKMAMCAVSDWLHRKKLQSRLLLQVHDELILEVPPAELELVREKLAELMSGVAQLKVPLLVQTGVGFNWDEAH